MPGSQKLLLCGAGKSDSTQSSVPATYVGSGEIAAQPFGHLYGFFFAVQLANEPEPHSAPPPANGSTSVTVSGQVR